MSKVIAFPVRTLIEERFGIPKTLPCGQIYQGCDFVARGASDDEVIVRAIQHAEATHSLSQLDWVILSRFCNAIREDEAAAM